jgi:uncharacterized protein YbaA (DUF1428 family)
MAYVDGIVAAVPADMISAAATVPEHLNELLRASSGAASTGALLLSAAAGAAVLLAASAAAARIVRRAGQARQQVTQV